MSHICECLHGRIRDPFTGQEEICQICDGDPFATTWEPIVGILGPSLLQDPYVPRLPLPDPAPVDDLLATFKNGQEILAKTGMTMEEAIENAGRVMTMIGEVVTRAWSRIRVALLRDRLQEERERRIRTISSRKNKSQARNWKRWKKRRRSWR